MRQFWTNLQSRERLVLIAGSVVSALLLIYLLVVEPYQKELTRLESSVVEQREVLAWMRQASAQVGQTQAGKKTASRPPGQSLLSLVDGSARKHGLAKAVKRVQPDGGNAVRVWLEQAVFDDFIKWSGQLEEEYGLDLDEVLVERDEAPGMVRVRLLIKEVGA